jgi:hypothetical protein
MNKFYYEVDSFIKYKNSSLSEACIKNKIPFSVKNRYTRVEFGKNYEDVLYFKEHVTTNDDDESEDVHVSKEEYYNSPQIKQQLLLKALKELK